MTDFMDSSREKIAQDIVASRSDIWLLWTQNVSGTVSLRGIFTEQRFANAYRKVIKDHTDDFEDGRIIRVWIEKTITNHLYGESLFEKGAYGQVVKFPVFYKK